MREIKFRAWNQLQEIMLFDEFIGLGGHSRNGLYAFENILMQFTGLKDKNGKEIYEGDILKCRDWGVAPNPVLSISVVEWSEDDKGWGLEPDPTDGDRYDLFRNIEIIGNIYENPELLKSRTEPKGE